MTTRTPWCRFYTQFKKNTPKKETMPTPTARQTRRIPNLQQGHRDFEGSETLSGTALFYRASKFLPKAQRGHNSLECRARLCMLARARPEAVIRCRAFQKSSCKTRGPLQEHRRYSLLSQPFRTNQFPTAPSVTTRTAFAPPFVWTFPFRMPSLMPSPFRIAVFAKVQAPLNE